MRNRVFPVFVSSILLLITVHTAESGLNSCEMYKEAAALAEDGKIDEAIEIFKRVIEQSPFYSLAHYGIGKAYLYKDGMVEDAIRHLRLSVTYDRELSKGYFYLGHAYKLAGKYNQAIHSFQTAFKCDKSLIDSLYYIGTIYELTGVKYKAELYFRNFKYEKEKKKEDILF